jgi:hypothetical protein
VPEAAAALLLQALLLAHNLGVAHLLHGLVHLRLPIPLGSPANDGMAQISLVAIGQKRDPGCFTGAHLNSMMWGSGLWIA